MGVIADYLTLVADHPDYPVLRFDRKTGKINDYSSIKWRLTLFQIPGDINNPRIEQGYRTRQGNYIIRSLVESGLADPDTWKENDALLFIVLSGLYGEDEMLKTSYGKKCEMFRDLDWQPVIVVDVDGGVYMSQSGVEIERAIRNARASMEMEGFAVSDEVVEFMRSNPSKEEIDKYVKALKEKYQNKQGD